MLQVISVCTLAIVLIGSSEAAGDCSREALTMKCIKQTSTSSGQSGEMRSVVEKGVNLTMIFGLLAGRPGYDKDTICQRMTTMDTCVKGEERTNCPSGMQPSPDSGLIQFIDGAKDGMDIMCKTRKAEFERALPCGQKANVVADGLKCDKHDDRRRKKRHSCKDYEAEVACVDKVFAANCETKAQADLLSQLTRVTLKNTPHTRNCKVPPLSSGAGLASAGVLSMVCGLAGALVLAQLQ